jgi:hypothetical protein
MNHARLRCDQIAEGIRGVIANPFTFLEIQFQHVFGPGGIVQEIRQTLKETGTAFVNEEFRFDAAIGIARQSHDGGPAVDPIHRGGTHGDTVLAVDLIDRNPLVFNAEDIRAGNEAGQLFQTLRTVTGRKDDRHVAFGDFAVR